VWHASDQVIFIYNNFGDGFMNRSKVRPTTQKTGTQLWHVSNTGRPFVKWFRMQWVKAYLLYMLSFRIFNLRLLPVLWIVIHSVVSWIYNIELTNGRSRAPWRRHRQWINYKWWPLARWILGHQLCFASLSANLLHQAYRECEPVKIKEYVVCEGGAGRGGGGYHTGLLKLMRWP
jgi:hypothetical protein